MARIRNIVMEGATGRLGSMVLTQRAGTGTVARTLAPEVSNPKSDAQQTRRVKWANLVNFYKVSKGWMAKAFENKASNQSDYNKFMSLNANTTLVALTKDQASQGGVIAGPYTISQGSLPSIEITKLANGTYASSIALGTTAITSATTVAEFSEAVLQNNAQLKEGYQISFISYQQASNGVTGVPYVLCGWYEVTLNRNDARVLNTVMPISFAAASVDNDGLYLGTGATLTSGAFAYIVSYKSGGKLLVSTQQLTVNNNPLYQAAISADALQAAIKSYGTTNEVFLAPGYAGGGQTQAGTNGILSIQVGDRTIRAGQTTLEMRELVSPATMEIHLINAIAENELSAVYLDWYGGTAARRSSNAPTVEGNKITIANWSPQISSGAGSTKASMITVALSNGKEFNFSLPQETPSVVVD